MSAHPLAPLAELPGVADAVAEAREATARLPFENALRRQAPAARAEATVWAARSSAALDGAELPLSQVREMAVAQGDSAEGALGSTDPVRRLVLGALRVSTLVESLAPVVRTAPAQALARLHVAAAGEADADSMGRPRASGVAPRDLRGLGPALDGPALAARLDGLARIIVDDGDVAAPILVAVVHGELLTLRPFGSGNGVVARGLARALGVVTGLDPTQVAVPEMGFLSLGVPAYQAAAAAYSTGEPEHVAGWIQLCCKAISLGAQAGSRVCSSIMSGVPASA